MSSEAPPQTVETSLRLRCLGPAPRGPDIFSGPPKTCSTCHASGHRRCPAKLRLKPSRRRFACVVLAPLRGGRTSSLARRKPAPRVTPQAIEDVQRSSASNRRDVASLALSWPRSAGAGHLLWPAENLLHVSRLRP